MRVLVTGGAGYIGSVITDQLVADGHSVVVYDNLSKGHADAVAAEASLVAADLLADHTLKTALADHRIEAVIHMAASSLVGESMTGSRPVLCEQCGRQHAPARRSGGGQDSIAGVFVDRGGLWRAGSSADC